MDVFGEHEGFGGGKDKGKKGVENSNNYSVLLSIIAIKGGTVDDFTSN